MGTDCLESCPECARHVRCGERACPFCGAKIAFFMRVPDYRLNKRFNRAQMLALGAALAAVGVACGNDDQVVAIYGAPSEPVAGARATAGTGGTDVMGGSGGTAGHPGSSGSGNHGDEGGGSGEGGAPR